MLDTPVARSAWCFAVSINCQPHVALQSEELGFDLAPLDKLNRKLAAFLSGELKSQSNLERFFAEFIDWQGKIPEADTLNGRITDLALAAMTAACDSLLDPECNDCELIQHTLSDLHSELDEVGGDASALRLYWQELSQEWQAALASVSQRPIARDIMKVLQDSDVSVFGLSTS